MIVLTGFWLWDYTDNSFTNFIIWSSTTALSSMIGCLVGLSFGGILDDDI